MLYACFIDLQVRVRVMLQDEFPPEESPFPRVLPAFASFTFSFPTNVNILTVSLYDVN